MASEFESIAILNIKFDDYRFINWNIKKNEAINKIINSTLEIKIHYRLLIWILVQIKDLLK